MSRDFEKLRRLVNEELSKLDEYRPNTFMLSRMEEKEKTDQDGDGDNDFDDVRIARRQASGMSKAAAIASVKRKPMGGKEKKRESVSLSESIRRMTRNERRALHEAVKLRILEEEDAVSSGTSGEAGTAGEIAGVETSPPAPPQPSATASSKVIINGTDKVAYIKREEKWYVNINLTLDQVLSFVKEENKDSIRKQIENNAKIPTGAVFTIRSAFIIESKRDQMNSSTGFVFKKTVDGFVDPNPITDKEITDIVKNYKQLKFAQPDTSASVEAAEEATMPSKKIGDYVRVQKITIIPNKVFIRIKNEENFAGFNRLFNPNFISKLINNPTGNLRSITIPGNGKVNPAYRELFNTLNPGNEPFTFKLGFVFTENSGPVVNSFNLQNGEDWYVCMFSSDIDLQALPIPNDQ